MNADLFQPGAGPNTAPKHNGSHFDTQQPETLHSAPVLNLDNVLMELEHGAKDLLKIAPAPPKCGQDLRTEIRQMQKQIDLKKSSCSSKQSLLSQVRGRAVHLRQHQPIKSSQALLQDIRSWHAKLQLDHVMTRNFSDILSDIRLHGRIGKFQALLRAIRRQEPQLRHVRTTRCRSMLCSDIRAMHGHTYKHLPPLNMSHGWLMQIHSSPKLNKCQTVHKQNLFSQIRCATSSKSLEKSTTKSIQMLLSAIRRCHGKHLYASCTSNKSAIMTEIRTMHGHAYKHLPLNSTNKKWLMDIHAMPRRQLAHVRTVDRSALMCSIRASRGTTALVHVNKCRVIQSMLCEIRTIHHHLAVVIPVCRNALMSDIRYMHGHAYKHLPMPNTWLMSLHQPIHLKHQINTVCRQSLMSEIRKHHQMKHTLTKSIQMLLTQIRMKQAMTKKATTVNRSQLMSSIRACHGFAPMHLPQSHEKNSWLLAIHEPHMLHASKTMNKQGLLSQVRCVHPVLHHLAAIKSIQSLLTEMRRKHELREGHTVDRHALMLDIRGHHGHPIPEVCC